jgi:hypothetical protein
VIDIEVLLETVARCRRRARLVLFVRYAALTLAIGSVSAAAASFVLQPLSSLWAAVAVCAGIAGSVLAAVRRCPSVFQIAAEIDRRYRLDDSVVAAFQLHGGGAPVAPLVVRQALTRARPVEAAEVFPMAARRHMAALGISGALLLVTGLAGEPPTAAPRLAGRGIAGEAMSSSPNGDTRQERTSENLPSPVQGNTDAMASQTERNDGPQNAPDRSGDRRNSSPAAAASTTRTPADPMSAAGIAPRSSSAALPIERQAGASRPSASTDGIVRDAGNGLGAAGQATSGSGGSGASSAGRGTGAGGVRGGALVDTAAGIDQDLPQPSRSGGSYVQTGRGGAAMTHDEVPPDLRPYVRDYFAAIAPQAGRK